MENEFSKSLAESFSMKGGEGPCSYLQNSSIQRAKIEAAKMFVQDAIANKFDPKTLSANQIYIADLGCSTGPNTFIAMQDIIEAIELQYNSQGLAAPEFQVFFNDLVSNDFNTLLKNLPPKRTYFAAVVPGSFHGRLFPSKTLHVVHSSSALNWISKIPEEIINKNYVAYNKERIHLRKAPKEVVDAYATQYQLDMDAFLNARAQELVAGGLMFLQVPVKAETMLDQSNISPTILFELLEACLLDMAKDGIFCEEKVDSFNLPIFLPPLDYMEEILERNADFSLEEKDIYQQILPIAPNVKKYVSHLRATMEVLIEKHFGNGIVDELFERFTKKLVEFPDMINVQMFKTIVIFVLLKRKPSA